MKQDLQYWIETNYPTKELPFNKCNDACRKMLQHFNPRTDFIHDIKPVLFIQVGTCNGYYHYWLIDEHRNIIDPTVKQFEQPLNYQLIANRFLNKDEIEVSSGAIFINLCEE